MSNSKLDATFGPDDADKSFAEAFMTILWDIHCDMCGWQSKGNPFSDRDRALAARDAHRCGDTK